MASYNNCFGNIFTVGLVQRLSELIIDIALYGTSVDQWENIDQCYIMIQRIMENIWFWT